MSYDIWLEETPVCWAEGDPAATALRMFRWMTTGDHPLRSPEFEGTRLVEEVGNYTSNVGSMWHKALGCSLGDLADKHAGEQVELISAGLAAMERNADEYRANNPPNGWGDFEGAHDYLLKLLVACLRHPEATIKIWR